MHPVQRARQEYQAGHRESGSRTEDLMRELQQQPQDEVADLAEMAEGQLSRAEYLRLEGFEDGDPAMLEDLTDEDGGVAA
jgi:hypothetical protein